MIEFKRTISATEAGSFYLNLTDDHDHRYGEDFPEHTVPLVVLDGSGKTFPTQKHHANQLWGMLRRWFQANNIRAGTQITVRFDPNERRDGRHVVHLIPGSTIVANVQPTVVMPVSIQTEEEQTFGLERQLHDFLHDNWSKTSLGRDWSLYAEQGDPEAGYEYPTDVGRIDLLAKHKREPRWLVIELKRGQTSDDTVGQTLRYMGWVRKNLAKTGEQVEGIIIAHQSDEALRYAITEVPHVKLLHYEVSFRLKSPTS